MLDTLIAIGRFWSCYGRAAELPREEQKAFHVSCTTAALAGLVTLVAMLMTLPAILRDWQDEARAPLLANAVFLILYIAGWLLMRARWDALGKEVLMTGALLHITALTVAFGTRGGVFYYFFPAMVTPLIVFTGRNPVQRIVFMAVALALFLAVNYLYILERRPPIRPLELSEANLRFFLLMNAVLSLLILAGSVYYFYRAGHAAEESLDAERQRSESLLLNILPPAVAERLKGGERLIADRHSAATVLFGDLVGFTPLSARMNPLDLLQLLNRVFTDFDALAERFGLEKIKTIGDAYMAVSGVPNPRPDHAKQAARMALAMQESMQAHSSSAGAGLELRVGLHSGPLVAGVIGSKKFIYDLWGDTVNVAARMEAHGIPGAIQCTRSTHDLLRDEFLLERRGEIEVKGRGRMEAFLLQARRPV